MKKLLRTGLVLTTLVVSGPLNAWAADQVPGADVHSLLDWAKQHNSDIAAMRHELTAATERQMPAGALAAPRFKMELQDVTQSGSRTPALLPNDAGATLYSVTQEFPWAGKRDLKRDIAAQEAEVVQGRVKQTWSDMAARIKTIFVQRYLVQANQRLVSENLDLMLQLEKVLQVRYAGGLAAQQDITRIHVEHTGMRTELVALGLEWRQTQTRLNALLARPLDAALRPPEKLRPLPEPAKLKFSDLAERLRLTSPQLAVESARVKSADKTRDLTYKSRYPDITVGINAMSRQGGANEWGLMLEFNLPIQRDVFRAQERETEAMLAAAQARQEATERQAFADLADNLNALDAARQTEHLMTYSLMPQADLTWRAALASYENGKADFAMLLDAQRQIRQARWGQIRAQAEAQMRLAEVERLLGEDL